MMRRVIPTIGLTVAGLAVILNFDTRSATSIDVSGAATIRTASSVAAATGGNTNSDSRTNSSTDSGSSTNSGSSTDPGTGSAGSSTGPGTESSATEALANSKERQQIMSQLPDWVITRIDDRFPDGIPLNLLEQVAYQLDIGFDGSTGTAGTAGTAGTTGGSSVNQSPSATVSPTAEVVDGPTANTPFGPYQVEVVIDGGQITDVTFIQTPRDMQSNAIARYALPRLSDQTLANQSGDVQFVSGATYTSFAYQRSLQAALDAAGF